MAFAASPSLSALTSSTTAAAAAAAAAGAASYSSSTPSSNAFHEPRPLHLSLKPISPLPKPHALSCSAPHIPRAAAGDGSGAGNRGDDSGGNGGKDGGGGEDDDDYEEAEFGPLLGFDEVLRLAAARGVVLPGDMMEAAKDAGIREVLLLRYFDLQAAPWPLGAMIRSFSMLRNRMLADPSFLFKVGTEIVIDSCCATFAEVQKRGKDFWAEFELYAADLLVGVAVDIALVGLLAPYVRIGKPSASTGLFGRFSRMAGSLPSSVFEAERPGCRFTVQQRIGTYFYKGVLYGSVGFVCGIIGQGIANMIMTAKRSVRKSDEDIPVPPLVKSAAMWGKPIICFPFAITFTWSGKHFWQFDIPLINSPDDFYTSSYSNAESILTTNTQEAAKLSAETETVGRCSGGAA